MKFNLPPRVIDSQSREAEEIIEAETRRVDAESVKTDKLIDQPRPTVKPATTAKSKLSRLIDDDFPFDESQLEAIHGMASQRFACMTGAAGTGKTTSLKKLVDMLQETTNVVDMNTYFKKADDRVGTGPESGFHDDDDYEVTEQYVPSICLCSFTGRASQMIKKNFPRDWHGNIMTIHRMLAYMPEWYEDYDEETEELKNKMRFVPTYTAQNRLPWDIVIIDEAGMLGVDLWHNVLAALKPGARVYMVGDINQLPPTHGKSIFGFALSSWPSWELTHIHRQKGVNNSIVDNAWRVLRGQTPISDDPKDPNWKFVMLKFPTGEPGKDSQYLRAWLKKQRGRVYDPIRDSIITPINAYESSAKGYALGQDPLNRQLALMFNEATPDNPRYIIDAGRERKYFAEGDKVMATRNDYQAGITNGMTGIITSITRNGSYSGDLRRFDTIENVNRYLEESGEDDDEPVISLEDLQNMMENEASEKERQEKEARDRGPASHIVVVRFGEGDHAFEITFATLAEVASLMTAYVVTCHKMQGGEAPFIVVICHQSHKRMLFREWLYTAITRASGKCVVLYTTQGLMTALSKQNIRGATLADKVKAFQALQTKGAVGAAVKVRIPDREAAQITINITVNNLTINAASLAEKNEAKHRAELMALAQNDEYEDSVNYNSDMESEDDYEDADYYENEAPEEAEATEPVTPAFMLFPPRQQPETRSTYGAVKMALLLSLEQEKKLLTYNPAPLAPAWPAQWSDLEGTESRKMMAAREKLREIFTLGAPVRIEPESQQAPSALKGGLRLKIGGK